MGVPLSFTAALSHFGAATRDLASAVWRAPFTGGKIRLVIVGLPLLFVTAGTGAVVYTVMKYILKTSYTGLKKRALYFKKYFESKSVIPIHSNKPQPVSSPRSYSIPKQNGTSSEEKAKQERVAPLQTPIPLTPLPPNAGEERNKALIEFLQLINQYLINPWILENQKLLNKINQTDDPFLKSMFNDSKALQESLQAIALWQLCIRWDQLEATYIQRKTPAPPTIESLTFQIQSVQIEQELKNALIQTVQSDCNNKVSEFQSIVTQSTLATNDNKLSLMGISLSLHYLVNQPATDQSTPSKDNTKFRSDFALIMHDGIAKSMTHMGAMFRGWITLVEKISSSPKDPPKRKQPPADNHELENEPSEWEKQIQAIIEKASDTLQKELKEKYSLPLWEQKQQEWQDAVAVKLGQESIQDKSSEHQFANQFMNEINTSEKTFLSNATSYKFSTALIAHIAFFRVIRITQEKNENLQETIGSLPKNILLQLEPLLTSALSKTATMTSEINPQTFVPRIIDYTLDLLECCRAMQEVRDEAGATNSSTTSHHINGQAIVAKLGKKGHQAVLSNQPEIQEMTWLRITKTRLEGLLRIKAREYVQSDQIKQRWLATLLNNSPNKNHGANLVGALFSLQNKLWKLLPGTNSIAQIIIMGLQTFLEENAYEEVQNQLNKLTSTEFLSKQIGIVVVKELISQSRDYKNWTKNLPLLQQTYAFLQQEEQDSVIKYLTVQYSSSNIKTHSIQTRIKALETSPEGNQSSIIKQMKEKEQILTQEMQNITQEYNAPNQGNIGAQNTDTLQEKYEKIKREKDLAAFERTRGLVIYVAGYYLEKKLDFQGGGSVKDLILAVIHETYTLLSYQEVVKHWIFTIVDLLIDELEDATSLYQTDSREESDDNLHDETPSLLEFIPEEKRKTLLSELTVFMKTSSRQEGSGWFSLSSWIQTGAKFATNWMPDTTWSYIERAAKEPLRMTPKQITEKMLDKLEAFVCDPLGLSDTLIQSLQKMTNPSAQKTAILPPSPSRSSSSSENNGKGKEEDDNSN